VKIAFVHKRFGLDGGTERMLEALVRGLRARGHELHVFAGSVDPRFQRASLATFHRLGAGGPGAGLRALRLLLSAALRVRRGRYDAVVHMGRTGPLDIYRAGGGSHRTWYRILLEKAGSLGQRLRLQLSLRHRLALWHERAALDGPGLVVVPSERARADFVGAYGSLGDKVVVVPNGVDLDRFHPKTRALFFAEQRGSLGIGPEELVLLFVGSDLWRKGLDRLLPAFAQVAPRREELRLLVLGDDSRRATFLAQAETLGVRDRVAFLPAHPAPEKLFAASDLLVLPTRHDPFANVTLEALACGTPVITSRENGAADALGPSEALVVLDDADDADAMALAIEGMLDLARMPARRAAARAHAEGWGEEGFVAAWERLLAKTSERRGG
jgi:UDP-glucose:(heptosyl)LPS alpha-1,3-glucosyltransferase